MNNLLYHIIVVGCLLCGLIYALSRVIAYREKNRGLFSLKSILTFDLSFGIHPKSAKFKPTDYPFMKLLKEKTSWDDRIIERMFDKIPHDIEFKLETYGARSWGDLIRTRAWVRWYPQDTLLIKNEQYFERDIYGHCLPGSEVSVCSIKLGSLFSVEERKAFNDVDWDEFLFITTDETELMIALGGKRFWKPKESDYGPGPLYPKEDAVLFYLDTTNFKELGKHELTKKEVWSDYTYRPSDEFRIYRNWADEECNRTGIQWSLSVLDFMHEILPTYKK